MAKGLEDTSFYRYNRLVSLNDVGGDPTHFGVTPEEFHREMQERGALWPYSMVSGSTHDSKRSEDVRARIDVLSEMSDEWARQVSRWRELNGPFKRPEPSGSASASEVPSPNDEYLLYQTLIGAWSFEPLAIPPPAMFVKRIREYMIKAAREAKDRTSWANPKQAYEEGLGSFVKSVIRSSAFLEEFLPFQRKIAYFGVLNSLSQLLLRLTVPGVPDVYQGNELWEFNLVDPDNRRSVDYAGRQRALQQIQTATQSDPKNLANFARHLLTHPEDGCVKMYVLWQALKLRNQRPELLQDGTYTPLSVEGEKAEHVLAFSRRHGDTSMLVVVPRLCSRLSNGEMRLPVGEALWGDCEIVLPNDSPVSFTNAFTADELSVVQSANGKRIRISSILGSFPVALLISAAA
jgi:(1->4)-alpha-D-glucan 1-alpha-D-glucosylmutase